MLRFLATYVSKLGVWKWVSKPQDVTRFETRIGFETGMDPASWVEADTIRLIVGKAHRR